MHCKELLLELQFVAIHGLLFRLNGIFLARPDDVNFGQYDCKEHGDVLSNHTAEHKQ